MKFKINEQAQTVSGYLGVEEKAVETLAMKAKAIVEECTGLEKRTDCILAVKKALENHDTNETAIIVFYMLDYANWKFQQMQGHPLIEMLRGMQGRPEPKPSTH